MTIQQTIKITADRRVHLDWTLPETWTGDSVRFVIFPVEEERAEATVNPDVPAPGHQLTPRQLAAIEKCDGIAKGILTSDDILESRRQDKELEAPLRPKKFDPVKAKAAHERMCGMFKTDGHEVDRFMAEKAAEKVFEL